MKLALETQELLADIGYVKTPNTLALFVKVISYVVEYCLGLFMHFFNSVIYSNNFNKIEKLKLKNNK